MAQGMRVTGAEPWISTLKAQDLVGTSGVLCATCLVMTWRVFRSRMLGHTHQKVAEWHIGPFSTVNGVLTAGSARVRQIK